MEAIQTTNRDDLMWELRWECEFFMSYMWDVVEKLVKSEIWLRTFDMIYEEEFQRAKRDSRRIDEAYERWDFGRPGIIDGGPNYIEYFEISRQKCLDILRDKGISLCVI